MDNKAAIEYLSSLLNKTLHVHTNDNRIFVGQFKCTDKDRNIILATTQEYRQPSQAALEKAAAVAEEAEGSGAVKLSMVPRFVGLVVVPGEYITKIAVEGLVIMPERSK
ncbi:MAG: hypothetical protein M1820_009993 [Bogoriella megaspora]|nr:MAG: hypothetical protein M1820_009993 [Bogoriella megaspora]